MKIDKSMKNTLKTVIAFTLLFAVCAVAVILDLRDKTNDLYPTDDTKIMLYGESHGSKEYYNVELQLWQESYGDGLRDLFLELPYYSAEFLNVWMREDTNALLDTWFEEISGTLSGNEYYYDFFCAIKESCPETVFCGTDVGHQFDTTGARYLRYLEENGSKKSENYRLAEDCIKQGKEYYEDREDNGGISELREAYMVSNFKSAYARQGGGKIMGVYGSYHTNINADVMASRLKCDLGDIISSVKISSVMIYNTDPYRFGSCVSGLILLVMLLVPNIIWANGKKPKDYDQAKKRESKVLLIFERIGEVAVTASLLVFPSIDPLIIKLPDGVYFGWDLVLWVESFILMILYEGYWIKYFRGSREMKNMYSSYLGFPVAGATLPVLAFILLGVYSENLILLASAVILGVGHIGIHLAHKCEAELEG